MTDQQWLTSIDAGTDGSIMVDDGQLVEYILEFGDHGRYSCWQTATMLTVHRIAGDFHSCG